MSKKDDFPKIFAFFLKAFHGIWLIPVYLYRLIISPLKPDCCRFTPTCSEYMIGAVGTHGIIVGTVMGIWRICRCNPFGKSGEDPVPPFGCFFWERLIIGLFGKR